MDYAMANTYEWVMGILTLGMLSLGALQFYWKKRDSEVSKAMKDMRRCDIHTNGIKHLEEDMDEIKTEIHTMKNRQDSHYKSLLNHSKDIEYLRDSVDKMLSGLNKIVNTVQDLTVQLAILVNKNK